MSETSVGQIGLDLVVNKNSFDKQMTGIQSLAKKAAAALAGAFAVKKLVNFGKECLELGSDLAEVQNVVDVTFPSMTSRVDEFAKSAISSFGLSETMAKQFTGTFGAMAKAFGFTEQQAYDMSSTLTGLAGDVASFYNISQEEAYTKLKSVFSGETETLKDLGVVMTQNALDAYAMANGFGKTTSAMSEAEKVALRYQFVQDKLAAAQGDFARTSGSWANQVRILKLQFDSLKATIGQGLINLFTPIIKTVNTLIGKLATLANAFKSFTELITGNKSSSGNVSGLGSAATDASAGLESASEAADSMASSADNAGSAAKKAAAAMRSLMGFDQINKLTDQTDDSSNSGSGTGSSTGGIGSAVDFGSLAKGETVIEKTDRVISALLKRCKELAAIFKKGFRIGFGDSEKKIKSITDSLKNIGKTAKDIFADPLVINAANNWANAVALSLGKTAGSMARIGLTMADNLIGGFDKYLSRSKEYIKQKLISIFDVTAEIADMGGDLCVALADIFDVFSGEDAKGITADIIGIFSDGFIGVIELGAKFVRDIGLMIVQPVTDNVGKIKTAFENTLQPIRIVLDTLYNAVQMTFQKMSEVYDEHIKPLFDSIAQGLSSIVATALDAYNNYIAPVLQSLAEKFDSVWNEHIQPVINKAIELLGYVADLLKAIWENVLVPFIEWIIENIAPVVGPIIEEVGGFVLDLVATIFDAIGGIIDILSGFTIFLTGVFTGDNEKAWSGIQLIVEGFQKTINAIMEFIRKRILTPFLDYMKKTFETDWTKRFGALGTVMNTFFQTVKKIWGFIQNVFEGVIQFIKGVFSGDWEQAFSGLRIIAETFQNAVDTIFSFVKNSIFTPFDTWLGSIFQRDWTENFGALGNVLNEFSRNASIIWDGIKGVFNGIITFISGAFSGNWSQAWGGIVRIFDNIFGSLGTLAKSPINAVISLVNSLINKLNNAVRAVENAFSFSYDFKNPLTGTRYSGRYGLNLPSIPTIPMLAQGGFVEKNTPRLAMIGDNRHHGEIVAPEDKLQEMAMAAAQAAGGSSPEVLAFLKQILDLLKKIDPVTIDEESLRKYFIRKTNQNTKSRGVCELVT